MKKIKLILTTFIGTSAATAIITPIATSCSSNENNSISETNYYEEINNAEKHLITEQSAIDLNNLFNANINSRTGNINLLTKEEIAEKVALDKENFIYKKLEENNLNKIFEESAIDVIYQSYLNQINETQVDNNLSRCGSIFSKHFWESVWMGIRCTAVYGFSLLVVYSPVLPILAEFILIGNYKNFISKINNLQNNIKIPKFLISLVIKTAIETKVFKNKTKCKWSFIYEMVNQMEKQILKYNFQKLNFTILFTLSFFFIYLFPILDLINTITRNDITLEQKHTDLVMWIIVWVVVYFIVTLIGFIFILISKIDKKWKLILSIFWILFKPIYMIIYCVKFKVIFSKYIENLSNINDEMTNKTSIYSFVLLNLFVIFSIIVIIFSSVLINKSTNEIVVEVFSILDLIVIIGYFFAFTKSIYCSLIKSNNSYIKRIPILFSFIWIFSKIKNKNQINN